MWSLLTNTISTSSPGATENCVMSNFICASTASMRMVRTESASSAPDTRALCRRQTRNHFAAQGNHLLELRAGAIGHRQSRAYASSASAARASWLAGQRSRGMRDSASMAVA